MKPLGSSPAPICTCGHSADDHYYEPWAGRCSDCDCPYFELDSDR